MVLEVVEVPPDGGLVEGGNGVRVGVVEGLAPVDLEADQPLQGALVGLARLLGQPVDAGARPRRLEGLEQGDVTQVLEQVRPGVRVGREDLGHVQPGAAEAVGEAEEGAVLTGVGAEHADRVGLAPHQAEHPPLGTLGGDGLRALGGPPEGFDEKTA